MEEERNMEEETRKEGVLKSCAEGVDQQVSKAREVLLNDRF